jgi:hypothetical protein
VFFAGQRAGKLRGRTGMWFLATDKLIASNDLQAHLAFLERLLCPEPGDRRRVVELRSLLERTHSRAHVTYFWRGEPGEPAPQIPNRLKSVMQTLAADIETDFGIAKTS